MKKGFRFASFLLALCMLCALLGGCMDANVAVPQPVEAAPQATAEPSAAPEQSLDENGSYTSRDDVALYIHSYGHLPPNFVTKDEARAEGWSGGSLEKYLPGMCIGGDRFGNREAAARRAGAQLDGMRREYAGRILARRGAHSVLQRRAYLLHRRSLRNF